MFSFDVINNSLKYLSNIYEQEENFDSILKAINNPYSEEINEKFLIQVMTSSLSQSNKVECLICQKKLLTCRMRQHIGFMSLIWKSNKEQMFVDSAVAMVVI